MTSRSETHLEILEAAAGRNAQYRAIGTVDRGPAIHMAYWQDFPEPGLITGFSVGLSAHPRWRDQAAPELLISVESRCIEWILATGFIAVQAANEFSFAPGETVDFRAKVSPDSDMDGFLLVEQLVLPETFTTLSTKRGPVDLIQLIPIHHSELVAIRKQGPAAFIRLDPDPCSVTRPPVF